MPVFLLDHKNQKLGLCPERIVDLLERRPRSDGAIRALDRMHRERLRLRCECERVLHVVQREFPFLRRNPGQNSGGGECGLCDASRHYESQSAGVSAARRESAGIGFILSMPNHRLIVEVQGPNSDDYHEQKKLIHRRLLDSPAYHGFKLITYNANDDEPLNEFENKLRSSLSLSLIGQKYEKRALRVKNP